MDGKSNIMSQDEFSSLCISLSILVTLLTPTNYELRRSLFPSLFC